MTDLRLLETELAFARLPSRAIKQLACTYQNKYLVRIDDLTVFVSDNLDECVEAYNSIV